MCHLKYQVGPLQQGSCIHHWHLELPLLCSDSSTVSQTFQIIFNKCPSSAHPKPFHSVTHPGKVLQRWCCKQELWQDSGHGLECFKPKWERYQYHSLIPKRALRNLYLQDCSRSIPLQQREIYSPWPWAFSTVPGLK